MKGVKKCFGLLLVLSIMVGLSLGVSSGSVNALQHVYEGIPLLNYRIPFGHYVTDENDVKSIDWSYHYSDLDFDNSVSFILESNSEIKPFYDSVYSALHPFVEDGHCATTNDFYALLQYSSSQSFSRIGSGNNDVYDNRTLFDSSANFQCRYHSAFGTSPQLSFNFNDYIGPLDSVDPTDSYDTGVFVYSRQFSRNVFNRDFNNYWYSSDGLLFNSQSISSEGIHYSKSFSFSYISHDNTPVTEVSRLRLPLWSYDQYWTDPSNFWSGREFEWKGTFSFDQPFQFGQFGNDSGAVVHLVGRSQDGYAFDQVINCRVSNTTAGEGSDVHYALTYSCHDYLSDDLIYALPYLEFYNDSDYFFSTTGDWRFASVLVVTDNDTTPGQSLGNYNNATNFADDGSEGSADWFSSLTNLFSFGFLNPFAPIFQLFTDNSNCVEIPIIANMLHAEETTVCPWFSPSVRTIVTPVLGLSSMMLIFGFAVRWLGSGSGNMLEDSVGHDWGGSHYQNKFSRRSKKQ